MNNVKNISDQNFSIEINKSNKESIIISLIQLDTNVGAINIISSYGDWSYLWNNYNPLKDIYLTFKEFIFFCPQVILMEKLTLGSPRDRLFFDRYQTINNIIEDLQKNNYQQHLKQLIMEELNQIEELNDMHELSNFLSHVQNSHNCSNIRYLYKDTLDIPVATTYSSSLKGFYDDVWMIHYIPFLYQYIDYNKEECKDISDKLYDKLVDNKDDLMLDGNIPRKMIGTINENNK